MGFTEWIRRGPGPSGIVVAVFVSVVLGAEISAQSGSDRPGDAVFLITGITPPAPGPDGRLVYEMGVTAESFEIDGDLSEAGWAQARSSPFPTKCALPRTGPHRWPRSVA